MAKKTCGYLWFQKKLVIREVKRLRNKRGVGNLVVAAGVAASRADDVMRQGKCHEGAAELFYAGMLLGQAQGKGKK